MPLRESEPFNEQNEEVYDQLISLIETTQGRLAPILVGCDDDKLRRRVIDRYEGEAAKAKIRAYRIVLGQEPSVRAGLMALKERETYLQAGGNAVFTVTGAEWLLRIKVNSADEQSDLDKFFGYLQWTREGLREFRYPIVIWVSQSILKEMSQRAPDFWSWRKAVLRFVDESAPSFVAMQTEPRQPASEPQTDQYLPPVAELQAEIDQLTERDLQSPGLATLYGRLGKVYAQRVERGEAKNFEDERGRSIAAFQEAIALSRNQDNLSAQGDMLIALGNFLHFQSRYTEAIECYQQSLDIAREMGDRGGEANSLGGLGAAYNSLGQYPQAIEFLQQSLEIKREMGDRGGEANSLGNLGNAYASLGQYPRAIEFLQQQIDIAREIGDRNGEGGNLCNLGNAYQALGQYQQAIEFYQQALVVQREVGNRNFESNSLGSLGVAYKSLGQYPRAIEFYQQHYDIAREIGDRNGEALSLCNMAYALAKLNRRWEARQHYEQAQQIYEALKLDHEVEKCKTALYNLGQIIPAQVIRAPQVKDESDAPTRPRKRRKTPWWVWGLVGVAIVLAIAWWLKK